MINYEEIADDYNFNAWKQDMIEFIVPLLKDEWSIWEDFITKDNICGYSLRLAYDQDLSRDEILRELIGFRIIDIRKIITNV